MNREEAMAALAEEASRFMGRSHTELASLIGRPVTIEYGKYQVEVAAHWDHKPNGALRLTFAVDNGSLRALMPLTRSSLVEPGMDFTGEIE